MKYLFLDNQLQIITTQEKNNLITSTTKRKQKKQITTQPERKEKINIENGTKTSREVTYEYDDPILQYSDIVRHYANTFPKNCGL